MIKGSICCAGYRTTLIILLMNCRHLKIVWLILKNSLHFIGITWLNKELVVLKVRRILYGESVTLVTTVLLEKSVKEYQKIIESMAVPEAFIFD